jgi:hypothetical protein
VRRLADQSGIQQRLQRERDGRLGDAHPPQDLGSRDRRAGADRLEDGALVEVLQQRQRHGRQSRPGDDHLVERAHQSRLGVVKQAVNAFHQSHPWITVKVVGGVNDDKIIAAIRGDNSPDVAQSFTADNTGLFCSSGGWIDLKPHPMQRWSPCSTSRTGRRRPRRTTYPSWRWTGYGAGGSERRLNACGVHRPHNPLIA